MVLHSRSANISALYGLLACTTDQFRQKQQQDEVAAEKMKRMGEGTMQVDVMSLYEFSCLRDPT